MGVQYSNAIFILKKLIRDADVSKRHPWVQLKKNKTELFLILFTDNLALPSYNNQGLQRQQDKLRYFQNTFNSDTLAKEKNILAP